LLGDRIFCIALHTKVRFLFRGSTNLVSINARAIAVSSATVVAADVRALIAVVGLLISGLVLILSTGAEWLNAT
jgi:hypothetical protein